MTKQMTESGFNTHNDIPRSSSFHQRLISFSNLSDLGFKEWVFNPDMLFGSGHKWWGDKGKREKPHEGLDLCAYKTKEGNIVYLDENIKIPAILGGSIVNVIKDFLGESAFVRHDTLKEGKRLFTTYGHIKPIPSINRGKLLEEGEIIGNISALKNGTAARPHLHISLAWIDENVQPEKLDWQVMADPSKVILIDPLKVINIPFSIRADI
jgi:hypothetical protein